MGAQRSNRFAPPVTAPFSLPEEARGGPETGAGLLPVRAYVQTPEALVRVEGEAVSQTPDAVLVRFGHGDGYPLQAWVWRAAVKHRRRGAGPGDTRKALTHAIERELRRARRAPLVRPIFDGIEVLARSSSTPVVDLPGDAAAVFTPRRCAADFAWSGSRHSRVAAHRELLAPRTAARNATSETASAVSDTTRVIVSIPPAFHNERRSQVLPSLVGFSFGRGRVLALGLPSHPLAHRVTNLVGSQTARGGRRFSPMA